MTLLEGGGTDQPGMLPDESPPAPAPVAEVPAAATAVAEAPAVDEAEETEGAENETEEAETVTGAAENVTPAPMAAAPAPPAPKPNELKVLIAIIGDSTMVGVKTPDTDPIFTSIPKDPAAKTELDHLAVALLKVPALVTEAKAKWATNPRNPKAVLPEPPAPAPARTATPARRPAAATESRGQPSFF